MSDLSRAEPVVVCVVLAVEEAGGELRNQDLILSALNKATVLR